MAKGKTIKEAKCLICKKIVLSNSIAGHLSSHKLKPYRGINWKLVETSSEKDQLNLFPYKKKATHAQCMICLKIMRIQGMSRHLTKKHYQAYKGTMGKNWKYIESPVDEKHSKVKYKKRKVRKHKCGYKPKQKRNEGIVITPEMRYLDIPATIRVPIVFGKVQIVNAEGV